MEYLCSHIHYGSREGLFFGVLGPVVLDGLSDDQLKESLNIYSSAQSRTDAPLIIHIPEDSRQYPLIVECLNELNPNRIIFTKFDNSEKLKQFIQINSNSSNFLITIPSPDDCLLGKSIESSLEIVRAHPGKCFVSSGCNYKHNFLKYGGHGFGYAPRLLAAHSLIARTDPSVLSFNWSPPKASWVEEWEGKWVCDVCGFVSKFKDQENYTKFGFTYCSIKCLSDHRKRHFK